MIYADFNGSSLLNPEVRDYLRTRLVDGPFANPNAIHCLGQQINAAIEKCRRTCAKSLGAQPAQIIFNSGSSEGISHVFFSILNCKSQKKKVIITSSIEHSAVVNAVNYYAEQGYQLETIPVDKNGVLQLDVFKQTIQKHQDNIALVSIMAANNETGVIQPYKDVAAICSAEKIPYFSDTTQFIGKEEFNFEESGIDYAVLSGHKVGALIGSGILLVKKPTQLRPFIFGGGQEKGFRGGTQNYIGIETLAIALKSFDENKSKLVNCKKNREAFEKKVKESFPNVIILGEKANRLASTSLISFPGIHGQGVQIELESEDIFVTTSSACSDNEPTTSKVLKAMGVQDDIGRGVVRISLCLGNDEKSYQEIFNALSHAYQKLGKIENF